ncbi:HU family DNA-binding protein [Parabacteroides chongii]|uniref:HU family DNA-binding protein n=1 Tax=Parabacteroides chongii TaxID=2685834 RepID=UPI00101D3705|nr:MULTISPECIES: HU family DNA-binding protein [Parabacteroides]WFE84390.1 HU family DNA-binding protein [Parabacteroides chongii]
MNKAELITAIAQDMGVTFVAAKGFIDSFQRTVSNILAEGDMISLHNFGCLQTKEQGARPVRNPKTGEPVMLAPRTTVRFKPGKLLLETVNKQK